MKLDQARYIANNLKTVYKFHITAREIKQYADEWEEVQE